MFVGKGRKSWHSATRCEARAAGSCVQVNTCSFLCDGLARICVLHGGLARICVLRCGHERGDFFITPLWCLSNTDPVAKWFGRLTQDLKIVGSPPGFTNHFSKTFSQRSRASRAAHLVPRRELQALA